MKNTATYIVKGSDGSNDVVKKFENTVITPTLSGTSKGLGKISYVLISDNEELNHEADNKFSHPITEIIYTVVSTN